MLAVLFGALKQAGSAGVHLEMLAANERGRAFYSRLGFRPIGRARGGVEYDLDGGPVTQGAEEGAAAEVGAGAGAGRGLALGEAHELYLGIGFVG